MERLTKRDEFGNADIIGVDSADLQMNLEFDEFNKVTDALNKLADYEDAEENGTLIKLPCKVGDTVWCLCKDRDNKEIIVDHPVLRYDVETSLIFLWTINGCYNQCEFNKKVFFTREAAEAALKERNNENRSD